MTREIARMVVETFRSPAVAEGFLAELSEREMEILSLVLTGPGNKEIGSKLNIRYYTVRAHRWRRFDCGHGGGRQGNQAGH